MFFEMAVALYAASALPMIEADVCEATEGQDDLELKDAKLLGLIDEIVANGTIPLADCEAIRIDV